MQNPLLVQPAQLYPPDWFRQRVEEKVANADRRYTPDLHYPLPIADIFDGLARPEGGFMMS